MDFHSDLQTLFTLQGLSSLIVLALLELILGIDNIIFISLLVIKLPEEKRFRARATGLSLAFVMRIIMLFALVWLSRITATLFTIGSFNVSIKDVLFFVGGGYLIYNTFKELREHLRHEKDSTLIQQNAYKSIILQIVLVDILFSFDSIFTAIGLILNFVIMALAVGLGMVFMVFLSGQTSKFIEKNPSVKTIALAFIIVVGLLLGFSAFHIELPKNYVYGAFFAALVVEMIRLRMKKSQ